MFKTKSIWKKLGVFKENGPDKKGARYFYSRVKRTQEKYVKVVECENGNCVALPIIVEADGTERVVFNSTTIQSLVDFLKGGK